jgi:protein tyrosine/serine phosphatase
MIGSIFRRLAAVEQRISTSFGKSIDSPSERLCAWIHFNLVDHAFLRVFWTNFHQVAPEVYRANQPSPRRLRRWKARGLNTVLSLRGKSGFSYDLFEREAARSLGMTVIDAPIYARKLAPRANLLALLDVFDRIERPFVMHCKSGADRAGLASVLWLLHREGKSLDDAMKMLSWRYLHLSQSKTGVLDHMMSAYRADVASQPMPIREWLEKRYDPDALNASFKSRKRSA